MFLLTTPTPAAVVTLYTAKLFSANKYMIYYHHLKITNYICITDILNDHSCNAKYEYRNVIAPYRKLAFVS
jgi:hypothetical protein